MSPLFGNKVQAAGKLGGRLVDSLLERNDCLIMPRTGNGDRNGRFLIHILADMIFIGRPRTESHLRGLVAERVVPSPVLHHGQRRSDVGLHAKRNVRMNGANLIDEALIAADILRRKRVLRLNPVGPMRLQDMQIRPDRRYHLCGIEALHLTQLIHGIRAGVDRERPGRDENIFSRVPHPACPVHQFIEEAVDGLDPELDQSSYSSTFVR